MLGKTGVYWGNDYRGVRVLADLRAIPDSPWFLVAKIDAEEILAEVRYRAMVIGAIVALCILIAAGATAYAYGRRQTGILGELEESERQQQKTHEEFRATLYSIADAVITTDTQLCVREMNRVAERLTGWSEAEARGRPLRETLHLINATTRATLKGPAANVLGTGLPSTLAEDTMLIARDGTERPIADSTAPIRDDHGVVSGVVMVFSDESERSAAQLALEQSEERVRLALAAANQGSYDLDVQTGQATVSSEYATMLGYDPAEFHEDTTAWIERMHPDDRESAAGVQRDYLAGRLPVYRVEVRQRTKTGKWRWILSQGKIVERAPDGRPLRMLGTHTDITDRKTTEEALRLQSAALNAAANAVVITNRDGTIVWVNAAFSTLSGYTAEEAIGKNPRTLVKSGAHDPMFYRQMWDTLLAGGVWSGEITNRRKDGSLYQESLTITPVKGAHAEATNFIAIKRDLTEEKQLQAQFLQAQKMESVGRLAGGIAHDFNNMLTVIIGSAEMAALDLAGDDPMSAELREIHAAGERAAALTRQLLAFSRTQILNLVVLNLGSVVTGMQGMLQRLLGERIELVVAPAAGLGNVRADRGQIEQIVLNLAINARDAMPDGGTLTIETRNADLDEAFAAEHPSVKPGPHVMMAISDTGIGMDPVTMQRIFEPFFTTKEHGKGTGLGLSTAYGITKQSNGSIWVYSELGRGTTFKIYLPRVDAAAKADQPTAIQPAVTGSGTILLVEDDEGIRHLADRVLRKAGYTVLTAGTGIEALRQLAHYDGTVDLLLTDMVLPGMSGWELAEQIAHEHPAIKVLCTSGYADEAIMRNRVLDRGVPFIAKPYSVADLTRAVQEILNAQ